MKIKETKKDKTSYACTVTIPAKDVEAKITERLTELAKTVEIDGFRKGKAPVSILRQKYENNVMGEVLENAAQESMTKVVEDNKLRPANQPEISVEEFEKGGDLVFSISMILLPDIKLMDLKKVKVEKIEIVVDSKEVDEALQNMAQNARDTAPIKEKRAAKAGDVLLFDFSGSVDGEKFEGGTAEKYTLELGSGQFIPGFEDQLIGTKAGDAKEVTVTFPADYGAENLAGKEAVFACKIHEIQEYTDATLNDEFAKRFGMEKLDDLKDAIKGQMVGDYENVVFTRSKRQVLDTLADSHKLDLPESLVEGEFEQIWQQFEQAKEAGQLPEEEAGRKESDLKKEYKEIAERRVSLGLILAEIGNQNNITLSDDEITNAMMREASRYQGQEQQVLEYYKNNQDAQASLRGPLYENKVVDFILGKADVTTKKMSTDELVKLMEAEEEKDTQKAGKKSTKKPAKKTAKKTAKKAAKKASKKAASKKSK